MVSKASDSSVELLISWLLFFGLLLESLRFFKKFQDFWGGEVVRSFLRFSARSFLQFLLYFCRIGKADAIDCVWSDFILIWWIDKQRCNMCMLDWWRPNQYQLIDQRPKVSSVCFSFCSWSVVPVFQYLLDSIWLLYFYCLNYMMASSSLKIKSILGILTIRLNDTNDSKLALQSKAVLRGYKLFDQLDGTSVSPLIWHS